MEKMKEWKFKKLTKLVEVKTSLSRWEVMFDGEHVGEVRREGRGYKAYSKEGHYIGMGNTKHEAKRFVAQSHYGTDNVIWND